jgi:hypothetical protein
MLMNTLRIPGPSRSRGPTARAAVNRRRWRTTGRTAARRRRQSPIVESAASPTPAVLMAPAAVSVPDVPAHVRQRGLVLASLVLCPHADLGKRHEDTRP